MNHAEHYTHFSATHPLMRQTIARHRWEYLDCGAGNIPLLMLPGGFGMAQTSWRYLLALETQMRVIALHYPPGIATLAELCTSLVELLDTLGLRQVHVLGGSASGFVAQVLVRRDPQRVASLILAQSGAPQPQRAQVARSCAAICARAPLPALYGILRIAIHAFLPGHSHERRFWRLHFAEVVAAQSREALVNRFHLAADFDANYRFTPTDLANWPGRVTILEAANDRIVHQRERAHLRMLYPMAQHILLSGHHNASVEQPEAQIAALRMVLTG